jgi:hypothetical protein
MHAPADGNVTATHQPHAVSSLAPPALAGGAWRPTRWYPGEGRRAVP